MNRAHGWIGVGRTACMYTMHLVFSSKHNTQSRGQTQNLAKCVLLLADEAGLEAFRPTSRTIPEHTPHQIVDKEEQLKRESQSHRVGSGKYTYW